MTVTSQCPFSGNKPSAGSIENGAATFHLKYVSILLLTKVKDLQAVVWMPHVSNSRECGRSIEYLGKTAWTFTVNLSVLVENSTWSLYNSWVEMEHRIRNNVGNRGITVYRESCKIYHSIEKFILKSSFHKKRKKPISGTYFLKGFEGYRNLCRVPRA